MGNKKKYTIDGKVVSRFFRRGKANIPIFEDGTIGKSLNKKSKNNNKIINVENTDDIEGTKFYSLLSKNEATGIVEGSLDYRKTENNEYHIERTNVMKDYRRKGVATGLLKEMQNIVGDNDIYFDTLTEEGEKLINKVASKKEVYKRGSYNIPFYKGRIKK